MYTMEKLKNKWRVRRTKWKTNQFKTNKKSIPLVFNEIKVTAVMISPSFDFNTQTAFYNIS